MSMARVKNAPVHLRSVTKHDWNRQDMMPMLSVCSVFAFMTPRGKRLPFTIATVARKMKAGSYVPPSLDAGSVVGSVALSAADSKLVDAGIKRQSEDARRKQEKQTKIVTIISTTVASLAIVTAIGAMWWEASAITYVAFAFPLVTAPLAISQRRKLHKMSTFKQQVSTIRILANDLAIKNNRLAQQNNELQKKVLKLQALQDDFDALSQQSGNDVVYMRQLASDYSLIQKEMTAITTTRQQQSFLQAILKSDTNGNFQLDSPQEVDLLIIRLKSIAGVEFDEGKMRDSIHSSQSKSLSTIFQVASDVVEEGSGFEMT